MEQEDYERLVKMEVQVEQMSAVVIRMEAFKKSEGNIRSWMVYGWQQWKKLLPKKKHGRSS